MPNRLVHADVYMTESQRKWVEALESGQFKQGKCRLQIVDTFCCLGVACIVAEREGIHVNRENSWLLGATLSDQPFVMQWLGLNEPSGGFEGGSLTIANDSGLDFTAIAALIRSKPVRLFAELG